jgi:hypothetical protein
MRNRAGITKRLPTGTDEVVDSNVTMTESGKVCDFGRGEYQPGDMFASSPKTSGMKRNSREQKKLFFFGSLDNEYCSKEPDYHGYWQEY